MLTHARLYARTLHALEHSWKKKNSLKGEAVSKIAWESGGPMKNRESEKIVELPKNFYDKPIPAGLVAF